MTPTQRSVTPVLQAVLVIGAFLVAGIASGALWHLLWDPPVGVVAQGIWQVTSEDDYRSFFSATGWFVVLSVGFGLLLGLVIGLLTRRRELLVLTCLLVGSVLGAVLTWRTGLALSNPDPTVLARGAEEGTLIPARIAVGSWSPFLAYPTGALFGMLIPFVLVAGRPDRSESEHVASNIVPAHFGATSGD